MGPQDSRPAAPLGWPLWAGNRLRSLLSFPHSDHTRWAGCARFAESGTSRKGRTQRLRGEICSRGGFVAPEVSTKNRLANGGYYRSLTRNIILTVLVVSLSDLILISSFIGVQFHTSYQEKVMDHLQEIVRKHKQNIDSFLNERLANVAMLVRVHSLKRLSSEAFLKEALSLFREEYGGVFVDLGLVDEHGVQVAYAGPFELKGANYHPAEECTRAIRSPLFISDVFLGLRGLPHFIITVRPVGARWLLRATIDFVAFNSLVEATQLGKTKLNCLINILYSYNI